jgi:hypothetical protein
LRTFPEEFTADSQGLESRASLPVPKIVDLADGVAHYDESQQRKQPDWTYAPS